MRNRKLAAVMAAVVLGSAGLASAQITIAANTNFNSGSFPGALFSGDGVPFLTTGNDQRGLWFNQATQNLLLGNRVAGQYFGVVALDRNTGAYIRTLDSTGIAGGAISFDQVAVTDDGVIYGTNLSINTSTASPFRVYRWANEAAVPTLYYSGNGGADAQRLGDSIAVVGNDATGTLAFGQSSQSGGPSNSFITLPTGTAGNVGGTNSATPTVVTLSGVSNNTFSRNIAFLGNGTTVLGKGLASSAGQIVTFPASPGTVTGTLGATPSLVGGSSIGLAYRVINGVPLAAVTDTNGNSVSVYDLTDPANPVLATPTIRVFPQGQFSGNPNATGGATWGAVTGRSVGLYTLNTNYGISAYTVTVPLRAQWGTNADGNYSVGNNWTTNSIPNTAGDTAVFGSVITAPRMVTLTTGVQVGGLTFNSGGTNSYTVAGTASTPINISSSDGSSTSVISVQAGNHTITAPIVLGTNNVNVSVAASSSLTVGTFSGSSTRSTIVTGNGTLRVTGLLDIGALNFGGSTTAVNIAPGAAARFSSPAGTGAFPTALDRVTFQVTQGGTAALKVAASDVSPIANLPYALATFANVDPKRPGQPFFSSLKGVPLAVTDVLAVTTYLGDTNLDGIVDGIDLANIIEGLSTPGASGWLSGDLNLNRNPTDSNTYLGTVTLSDLGLFNAALAAYQANPVPLLGIGLSRVDSPITGAVPEPAGLAVVPMAAAMLRRRRK